MDIKNILKHVEDFGFQVEQLNNEDKCIHYCFNPLSKNEFILTCVNEDLEIPCQHIQLQKSIFGKPLKIVYLIKVNDNIDQIIQLVQSDEHQSKTFLIYDEEDEIEFFLKDLWSVIIEINKDLG
jgi:hypothetical protein